MNKRVSVLEVTHTIYSIAKIVKRFGLSKPSGLKRITFHITKKCNLSCKHCYFDAGEYSEKELCTHEIFRLIDEVHSKFTETELAIGGGEPFCKDDFQSILDYLVKKKVRLLSIATNGTLLTDQMVARLRRVRALVQVSLDGAEPSTNDSIRGAGTHQLAIEGIKKLVESEVPVHINMVLLKPNLHEINKMAKLSLQLGLKAISYHLPLIDGRAEKNRDLQLTSKEVVTAINSVFEVGRRTELAVFMEEIARYFLRSEAEFCGAGKSMISIGPNGNVFPCAFLHKPEMLAGTIREKSLKTIYEHSRIIKNFKVFSSFANTKCRDCNIRMICKGGCLARTYKTYQRLDLPDPLCYSLRKAYGKIMKQVGISDKWGGFNEKSA